MTGSNPLMRERNLVSVGNVEKVLSELEVRVCIENEQVGYHKPYSTYGLSIKIIIKKAIEQARDQYLHEISNINMYLMMPKITSFCLNHNDVNLQGRK